MKTRFFIVTIRINPEISVGKIKPMHAVGQAPIAGLGKGNFHMFHYLTDAHYYVLDQERLFSWSPAVKEIENNAVVMIEI